MNRISAVIITLNEEKHLARCLESILEVCDEIIVVDSFSTDQTEAIARSYPKVTFLQQSFLGYTQQKNFAAQQAHGDLILSLDADEALDETAKAEIFAIRHNPDADVYSWNRLNNYCGKWIRHGAWYPDCKKRLWKKGSGQWTGINLHETFEVNDGCKERKLMGHILHYTTSSLKEHVAQINNFTSLAAQELYQKRKKGAVWRMFLSPVTRFFRDYIIKLGFLDGFHGFMVASHSAYAVYLKYCKLRFLQLQERHKD
jgi:glycosyltransferase involved in cell wall biosynthesis